MRKMTWRRAIATVMAVAVTALTAGATPVFAQAPAAPADDSMKGKVVLVTGSTDGLGRELALRLAARGAQVIVHGRNKERGQAVVDEITKAGRGSARFYAADFASLDEVRGLAQQVLRDYDRLDVLVNNAAVLFREGERRTSRDGYELHMAVNYLASFLLTRTLLPRIVASAPARIVNVTSIAQAPIDFDDFMLQRPGASAQGYWHSKLAQILFTIDLAEELKGKGVIVTAVHPASMMDTNMVRSNGMEVRSTVSAGADAVMRQIVGKDVESGQYYRSLEPARANAQAYDAAARAKLRQISLELTGPKK